MQVPAAHGATETSPAQPEYGYTSLRTVPLLKSLARVLGWIALSGTGLGLIVLIALVVLQRVRERSIEASGRVIQLGRTAVVVNRVASIPWSSCLFVPRIFMSDREHANGSLRRAIVAHELHHLRRLDSLRMLGEMVTVVVFWMNPVLYAVLRRDYPCETDDDE